MKTTNVKHVVAGLATVGLAAYLIYRARASYKTDVKVYEAAVAAVKPEELIPWKYSNYVRQLRGAYIMDNVTLYEDANTFSAHATLDLPFPDFWAQIEDSAAFTKLQTLAADAGATVEEAKSHILLGTMKAVPSPLPLKPSQWDHNWPLLLQLPAVTVGGLGVQFAIWMLGHDDVF